MEMETLHPICCRVKIPIIHRGHFLFVQKSLSEHSLSSNFIFSASAGQLAGSCGRKAFLGKPPTSTGSSNWQRNVSTNWTFDSYPDLILRRGTLSDHLIWQCWSGNSAKPSGCLLPNSLVVAIVAPTSKNLDYEKLNGRTCPHHWLDSRLCLNWSLIIFATFPFSKLWPTTFFQKPRWAMRRCRNSASHGRTLTPSSIRSSIRCAGLIDFHYSHHLFPSCPQ